MCCPCLSLAPALAAAATVGMCGGLGHRCLREGTGPSFIGVASGVLQNRSSPRTENCAVTAPDMFFVALAGSATGIGVMDNLPILRGEDCAVTAPDMFFVALAGSATGTGVMDNLPILRGDDSQSGDPGREG